MSIEYYRKLCIDNAVERPIFLIKKDVSTAFNEWNSVKQLKSHNTSNSSKIGGSDDKKDLSNLLNYVIISYSSDNDVDNE